MYSVTGAQLENAFKGLEEKYDEIIVERQNQRSTIAYNITLKNEKETHYLVMTVSHNQEDVINYLDSLIKNPQQPPMDNEPETPENKPTTGLNATSSLVIFGGVAIVLGVWLALERKVVKK